MNLILAALDFSSTSTAVAGHAIELARAFQARLVIVHVFTPPEFTGEPENLSCHHAELVASDLQAAQERLAQAVTRLRSQYEKIDSELLTGEPAAAVVVRARELKADCLVIGSHGHGAWHDLLFGSTTNHVLSTAPCRIALVPASRARRKSRRPERQLVGAR